MMTVLTCPTTLYVRELVAPITRKVESDTSSPRPADTAMAATAPAEYGKPRSVSGSGGTAPGFPMGSRSRTRPESMPAAMGAYWSRSCIDPALSSRCLVPAQIWYAVVAAMAPAPTSKPRSAPPPSPATSCGSVTVARATPAHTTPIDAVTALEDLLPKKTASARSTAGATAILVIW